MTKPPSRLSKPKLTPEHVATLQRIATEAGLKISSMHLIPSIDASEAAGTCHSQQLPNGHWIIVCD